MKVKVIFKKSDKLIHLMTRACQDNIENADFCGIVTRVFAMVAG